LGWCRWGYRDTDHDLSAFFISEAADKATILNYGIPGLKLATNRDKNFGSLSEHFNKYRITEEIIYAVHSGDVRHKAGPCAEYIDIDIKGTIDSGYRYVFMMVNDYTGKGIGYHKTSCGFMSREYPESNLTWYPKTLENAIALTNKAANLAILLFDLKTMEYIMINEDYNGIPVVWSNPESIKMMLETYAELPKFSVYDLLKLHAKARGTLVKTPSYTFTNPDTGEEVEIDADYIFKYEDFVGSYAKLGEWLGI